MKDAWDPKQYDRFRAEREKPFYDLLALVRPKPGMRVVDLGCGTGALTKAMHTSLGARETLGVDTSDAMLEVARTHACPGLTFERGDLATWSAGPVDLVFSNAAVHWVDDHASLFARLTSELSDGGQLAIQMPANHDHVAFLVAADVAHEAPFASALGGYARTAPVLAPEAYASILDRLGYREQDVRLQVYGHHLASRDEVVEWVKGTLLTDYTRRLPEPMAAEFLARYRERLVPKLDDLRPYFYPFKRILIWGRR